MKRKHIQFAVALIVLGASASACGPSKEAMCERINASRSTPSRTKADEEYDYARCLSADDAYVKKLYAELIEREKNK
jgi:hypothetical protein